MKNCIIAALASAVTVAQADFLLYFVQQNDIIGGNGAGYSSGQIQAFPGPPSCDDTNAYRWLESTAFNDATKGGWACDGCYNPQTEGTILDWPIERLELYNGDDSPFFNTATGSITIKPAEEGWFMYAKDDTIWGQCFKQEEIVDDFTCVGGPLSGRSGVQYFECWSDLEASLA